MPLKFTENKSQDRTDIYDKTCLCPPSNQYQLDNVLYPIGQAVLKKKAKQQTVTFLKCKSCTIKGHVFGAIKNA